MTRSPPPRKRLRQRLDQRERQLCADIAATQARSGELDPHEVIDRKEEASDLVLATIDSAGIERDLAELRGIEQARRRIEDGRYGVCDDCGDAIEPARLQAQPAALRCAECQCEHERRLALQRALGGAHRATRT